MKLLRKLKKFFRKKSNTPIEEVPAQYRCPQCGKFTDYTTEIKYKQLLECVHCGRTMVICHGKTIGYK